MVYPSYWRNNPISFSPAVAQLRRPPLTKAIHGFCSTSALRASHFVPDKMVFLRNKLSRERDVQDVRMLRRPGMAESSEIVPLG